MKQTGGERKLTCYNCHAKCLSVNDCPKLDEAGKDKFWAAYREAGRNQPNTKKVFINATITGQKVAVVDQPAPATAPRQVFLRNQRNMNNSNVIWPW